MKRYEIRLTREACKDIKKLSPKLKAKLRNILTEVVSADPHVGKKLVGDLAGFYSIHLTYQDRIVYNIDESSRIVFVHRARTHYGQ